jgi:hypothetical protein
MLLTPDDLYRALPRVSNSDLTLLKEEHLGYGTGNKHGRNNTNPTKVFGRAFHQHLLEPETIGTVLQQFMPDLIPAPASSASDQSESVSKLMKTVRDDAFCRRYLRQADCERVVLSTDSATGIACKARLDMVYTSPKCRNALIIDIKPTSARTPAQFLESCYTYDYDRQAAFYLDSLRQAESGEWAETRQFRFVFIGVMKESPHRLFAIEATSIPGFVEYGRKKYRFWLRKWREEQEGHRLAQAPAWQLSA